MFPRGELRASSFELAGGRRGPPLQRPVDTAPWAYADVRSLLWASHFQAATALIDGNNAQGAVVGKMAMELAIKKAKECGVAWVVARNSNHYGIAGESNNTALVHIEIVREDADEVALSASEKSGGSGKGG